MRVMSEDGNGEIKITVEGETVKFTTNYSITEMNYWLDHVKFLLVSGQVQINQE